MRSLDQPSTSSEARGLKDPCQPIIYVKELNLYFRYQDQSLKVDYEAVKEVA